MVKKAKLCVGLKLRKKSWKNRDLYVTVTAIGDKHILLKYSKNCIWQADKELVYRDYEVMKDWEIFEEMKKDEYIIPIKGERVKIIGKYKDLFTGEDVLIYLNTKQQIKFITAKELGNLGG